MFLTLTSPNGTQSSKAERSTGGQSFKLIKNPGEVQPNNRTEPNPPLTSAGGRPVRFRLPIAIWSADRSRRRPTASSTTSRGVYGSRIAARTVPTASRWSKTAYRSRATIARHRGAGAGMLLATFLERDANKVWSTRKRQKPPKKALRRTDNAGSPHIRDVRPRPFLTRTSGTTGHAILAATSHSAPHAQTNATRSMPHPNADLLTV